MTLPSPTSDPSRELPDTYYTFRKLNLIATEVCKWEVGRTAPAEVYVVTGKRRHCTCPSWKVPCKHAQMVTLAQKAGKLEDPTSWAFADGTWYRLDGI